MWLERLRSGDEMTDELKVEEILRESFNFIVRKPVIIVPMLIVLLLNTALDLFLPSFVDLPDQIKSIEDIMPVLPSFLSYLVISSFLLLITYAVANGVYPLIVKNIIESKEVELNNTLRRVLNKAPTLIGVAIIITFIFSAGLLFFIIPGVIFAIWYFYTVPAIMLENKGVFDGMRASKEFARDKKYKTFLLLLIPLSLLSLSGAVAAVFETLSLILDSIIFTWISIMPAYVYIKYNTIEQN